jgi:hypothetical protein
MRSVDFLSEMNEDDNERIWRKEDCTKLQKCMEKQNTKVSLFLCFVRPLMLFDVSFLALAI